MAAGSCSSPEQTRVIRKGCAYYKRCFDCLRRRDRGRLSPISREALSLKAAGSTAVVYWQQTAERRLGEEA